MAGIFDYLDWRGDIPITADNLNEVDNLIFCLLSYVDFDGILPRSPRAEGVTLREVAKEYFFTHKDGESHSLGLIIPSEILSLFRRLAETPRYQALCLTGYVNEVCKAREMQFSALTILLPDNCFFTAFRGTDDSIIGWKEDFKLSYMDEVPAQRMAATYLNYLPLQEDSVLYIGGHSKGGNLAVWGAVHASDAVRNAVKRVFCNDGPGFTEAMLSSEAYQAMSDRLTYLLPDSSLVGLLLSNDSSYEIVKSRTSGVFQHNALSWEIMGASFLRKEKLSWRGVHNDTVLRERINRMSRDEKRMLVDLFFEVLESTGATTLTELMSGKIKAVTAMLKTYQSFDKTKKEMFGYLFGRLLDSKKQGSKALEKKRSPRVPPAKPRGKVRVCLNFGKYKS